MSADLDIDISILAGDWPEDAQMIVETAAKAAWLVDEGACQNRIGELSILLSDDEMVQGLNNKWRGLDKPTNVLSFPTDDFDIPEAPRMLGDVILALETLKREASQQNKEFNHHLTHLVIHGVLHLLGFDHIEENDADAMEALEIKLLANIDIQNPYIAVDGITKEEFIKNGQ